MQGAHKNRTFNCNNKNKNKNNKNYNKNKNKNKISDHPNMNILYRYYLCTISGSHFLSH